MIDQLAAGLPSPAQEALKLLVLGLHDSSLFVEHSVEEWLFGYEDPILKSVSDLLKPFGINLPGQFGLFLGVRYCS